LASPDAAAAAVAPATTGRPLLASAGADATQGAPRPFQAAMQAAGDPNGDGLSGLSLPPDQVVTELTAATPLDLPAILSADRNPLLWTGGPDPGLMESTASPQHESGHSLPADGNGLPQLFDQAATAPTLQPAVAALMQPTSPGSFDTAHHAARTAALPIAMAARMPRPDTTTTTLNTLIDAESHAPVTDFPDTMPALTTDAEPALETDALNLRQAQRAIELPTTQADAQTAIRTLSAAAASGAEPAPAGFGQSTPAGIAQFDQLMQTSQFQNMRPLQPLADPDVFSHGLGHRLMLMSEDGVQSARLKLYPENLGALDVRIQIDDDMARVWFTAQHGQTREALEAAMPRLRDLFAEQGMQLVQADVETGRHDEHAAGMFEPGDDAELRRGDDDPDPLVGARPRTAWVSERALDVYV